MPKGKLVRFNEGDILFNAGETTTEMYIIKSGTVKIMIRHNNALIPLTELGAGSYVGEMSFLTGVPRSASVIAQTPITAAVISASVLHDENLGLSNWAVSLAKVLVHRIRKTTEILGSYISQEPEYRSKADAESNYTDDFTIVYRDAASPPRLYLKGSLTNTAIDLLKSRVREIKLKTPGTLILDFSDVIDIDQTGINYLYGLSTNKDVAEGKIKIENVQLIRDTVLSIKGIQDILTTTHTPLRRVEKGEILIKQGDAESTMYVVKTGSFSIYRQKKQRTIPLAKAETGDVIGEMALIKEGPRSATVRAEKTSIVHVIETREFYRNVYNVPGWFMELIQGLVQRLRDTDEMLEHLLEEKKLKQKKSKWPSPFAIYMDDTHPGMFVLKGNLTLSNMQYVRQSIIIAANRGIPVIKVDLSKVNRIDRESIIVFLNLYTKLRKKKISLTLEGPQKSILDLFQQYEIEPD